MTWIIGKISLFLKILTRLSVNDLELRFCHYKVSAKKMKRKEACTGVQKGMIANERKPECGKAGEELSKSAKERELQRV